jgi:GTP cyclohydrolase I
MQIVQELQRALGTEDVACVIDAKHLCVNSRGISDIESSSTVTSNFENLKNHKRAENFKIIKLTEVSNVTKLLID